MRRIVAPVLFAFCGLMLAQDKEAPPRPAAPAQEQPAPTKNKDKKKKDKDSGNQPNEYDSDVFSTAAANNVLNDLRDGLEGHSQRIMLSAFDGDKMDGFLSFEDQIEGFFNRYQAFRVHFRIAQTSTDGSRGVALVDCELEEIPRQASAAPVRKSTQLRFELERGKKGWKIVDFRPRGFFS